MSPETTQLLEEVFPQDIVKYIMEPMIHSLEIRDKFNKCLEEMKIEKKRTHIDNSYHFRSDLQWRSKVFW